jgi:hypothetical protein
MHRAHHPLRFRSIKPNPGRSNLDPFLPGTALPGRWGWPSFGSLRRAGGFRTRAAGPIRANQAGSRLTKVQKHLKRNGRTSSRRRIARARLRREGRASRHPTRRFRAAAIFPASAAGSAAARWVLAGRRDAIPPRASGRRAVEPARTSSPTAGPIRPGTSGNPTKSDQIRPGFSRWETSAGAYWLVAEQRALAQGGACVPAAHEKPTAKPHFFPHRAEEECRCAGSWWAAGTHAPPCASGIRDSRRNAVKMRLGRPCGST